MKIIIPIIPKMAPTINPVLADDISSTLGSRVGASSTPGARVVASSTLGTRVVVPFSLARLAKYSSNPRQIKR